MAQKKPVEFVKGENHEGKRRIAKKRVKRGKREEEKEKYETGAVKGRCDGCVFAEAFQIFSQQRVVVIFLGRTSWISLMPCLIVSLFLVSWCVL